MMSNLLYFLNGTKDICGFSADIWRNFAEINRNEVDMIKYYCDECDNVLDADHQDVINPRFKSAAGHWTFEIIQSYKGTSSTGNLCEPCLRNLLKKAVDNWVRSDNTT